MSGGAVAMGGGGGGAGGDWAELLQKSQRQLQSATEDASSFPPLQVHSSPSGPWSASYDEGCPDLQDSKACPDPALQLSFRYMTPSSVE